MFWFNNRLLISLFLVCILSFHVLAEKRALIVAIGKYPVESGWRSLSSENDVQIIKTALMKQGFNSANIKVLLNQNATKAGIVNAFNILISKSQTGDVVVFHFSGHGQQVTDTNGDEIDGLDEALVSYNALKTRSELIPDARFHLLDDELRVFLSRLRSKVGPSGDVLFFIDACHSGTATRSSDEEDGVTRGTNQIFEIPGFQTKTRSSEEYSFFKNIPTTRGASTQLSPFIILSACLAYQTNKEYKNYGSLSYAISNVLSKNLTKSSYLSFFEAIRNEMIPLMSNSLGVRHDQTPQIEGEIDRKVFAGKTVNIPQYFTVNSVKGQKISVNAGNLAGVFAGAELAFYPPDTYERTKVKPFFTSKVDTANLIESILTLPQTMGKKKIQSAWVFVNKYHYRTSTHENPAQMRARILRTQKSISKDVSFKIVPIDVKGSIIDLAKKIKNGNITFQYGERFVIEVSNKSMNPVFFQLIDIMPTDEIRLIIGRHNETKYDYYLTAGQTRIFSKDILKVDAGSPLGMETIVLIASEKVLDLSPLQTQKPVTKRGDMTAFEEWINELYSDERSIPLFDSNNIFIDRKSFIVKKQINGK